MSDSLLLLLERLPLSVSSRTEAAMQDALEVELKKTGMGFEREVKLSKTDRIDFLIGNVGVEMKVKGSFVSVVRQLQRYARSSRISELVLFTSRPKLTLMPESIGGKRVRVAFYRGAF
jgi:hypothetical protein